VGPASRTARYTTRHERDESFPSFFHKLTAAIASTQTTTRKSPSMSSPSLLPERGSVVQVVLATVPLLIVLLYFLYLAWKRPTLPIYNLGSNYTEDQWQQALQETGSTIRLMDIVYVYLGILVTWTTFGTYLASFIPKRRHLIGRYLREGATTVGGNFMIMAMRSILIPMMLDA
jgi:predicted PurR-regulated permease PerM